MASDNETRNIFARNPLLTHNLHNHSKIHRSESPLALL
jgi:hypothetical protein